MLSTLIASVVLITLTLAVAGYLRLTRLAAAVVGTAALPLPRTSQVAARRIPWTTSTAWEPLARKLELTKQEAEDLLDWQEATGQPRSQVTLTPSGHFTVSQI